MYGKNYNFHQRERDLKTILEMRLIEISQEIRSKPNWIEDIRNPDIVSTWKSEIRATDEEFQYVLDELNYYASLKEGLVEVGPIDGIWQSDGLIETLGLETAFKEAIFELLESLDDSKKHFHPGSNNLVVDLVHPSLYCFVRGVTTISNEVGIFVEDLNDALAESGSEYGKFRWLPSEIVCDDVGEVKISSYINNLPPKRNARLYGLIGQILSRFLPLFSRVLRDLVKPRENRIKVDSIEWETAFEYKPDEEGNEKEQYEKWKSTRRLKWPQIPQFERPTTIDISDFDFKGKKFQVIVKITNIMLTPQRSVYKGGFWRIEGTDNERIVATGIYYYSSENVTESTLEFRQAVRDPMDCYDRNDIRGACELFGLKHADRLNQKLGSFIVREGRCIVFPNIYQYNVTPFHLVDREKKGHRKFLTFFLIDPSKRILSTKNVAPQNRVWDDRPADRFTMQLEDAKRYRQELISQRKIIRDDLNLDLYEREFSIFRD